MFCPECHAEYRPGFDRCSDCDVELVWEPPTGPKRPRPKGNGLKGTALIPSMLILRGALTTLKEWREYERQTGELPWLSILVHSLNWIVAVSGLILLIWFGEKMGLSRWGFVGVFAISGAGYLYCWDRVKRKVKLNRIRTARRLRRGATLQGLKPQ